MNRWKVLAIIFALLTFGAAQESFRIFTSTDSDIANNRSELIPMAVIITLVFLFFTIRFWLKSYQNNNN